MVVCCVKTPNGFGNPIVMPDVDIVVIQFMAAVNDKSLGLLEKTKGNFDLYLTGYFDVQTGKVKNLRKFKLVRKGVDSLLPEEVKDVL